MQLKIRFAVVALFVISCAGCTQFSKQYQLAEAAPPQADQPLLGAYQGTWHSRTGSLRGPIPIVGGGARIVIDRPPDSKSLEIWTSLDNFWSLGTIDYDPANLQLHGAGSGATSFTAKIAAGIALVLYVDGRLEGDTLSLTFKVVDVGDNEVQHDQGTITLHRVTNQK